MGIPVFFQRVSGSVENFAPSDPDPIEFAGGIGATLGPQFTISGNKSSLIRLDLDAKISSEQLSGTGKASFINDKIGLLDGTTTLNWNKKFYEEKGNLTLFDGFVKTNSGFRTDSSLNIKMTGSASVGIPNFIPLFGGAQLGSGNYLLDFSNDGNLSNDFAAGWGTLNIQKFGFEAKIVAGAKLYFDGKFQRLGAKDLPPVGSWQVAANTPWIVLSADWENDLGTSVPIQIEAPDGSLINEVDFAANNIAVVDELTNSTAKTVIIFNPTPGVWDINIPNTAGLGQVKYNAVTNSNAPTIQLTSPSTDVTDQNVTISYNAFDSDSQAKISLFYDTDNQGFDGILIKDGLDETDGAGSFVWNTEGIATGSYYIYAMAVDENNPPALSYSTGQVKVTEAADLSVTAIANANSVNVGTNVTYTVTVTNNGTNTAKGVTLSDLLPQGVNFVSASITPTSQDNDQLTFDLGSLATNAIKTLDITLTAPTIGTITNTASIQTKTYDPDVTNNVSIVDTTVSQITPEPPDLVVTSDFNSTTVNLGDKISYTLTVTNNGNGQATGVKLIDDIGSLGVKDVTAIPSKGTASIDSYGNIVAELGTLNKGEKATVAVTATAIVANTLINTVTVTSNEDDLNNVNNSLIQNQLVNAVSPSSTDLELTQTVDYSNVKNGDQVTLTLSLTNKGPGIASSIKVKDLLPLQLDFISATAEQGSYDSQTGVWDVGNMKDNLTRTLTLTAKVNQDGSIVNTAQIVSLTETDPNSANNQASLTLNAGSIASGLTKVSDDVFTLAGTTPKLKVSLVDSKSALVNELAVFTVDDATGKINGLAPGSDGYIQAALAKARPIFSNIANIPNGFETNNLSGLLEFDSTKNLRFILVKNSTLDNVKNGITPTTDLLFSDPSLQQISDLGNGSFSLAWKDSASNTTDFKDLVVKIESTTDTSPLGTSAQNQSGAEIIDLRSAANQTVNAEFSIYREAAYNNYVGFYQINDTDGSITDSSSGAILKPGDVGYIKAAVQNRVSGIDLSVANQSTATLKGQFTSNSLFAPFIIVDASPTEVLDTNTQNDPAVYFAFIGANSDKVDHIRLLANNVFGFEDLPKGGDLDYNDVIVRANLVVA